MSWAQEAAENVGCFDKDVVSVLKVMLVETPECVKRDGGAGAVVRFSLILHEVLELQTIRHSVTNASEKALRGRSNLVYCGSGTWGFFVKLVVGERTSAKVDYSIITSRTLSNAGYSCKGY